MKNKLAYHILAISIIAIWGVTFINTKYLILNGLNPQEIFLLRFILAYIGIWTFSPHKLFTDNWHDELTTVMLGITGGSLYFLAENTAIQYTLVNNVAFIVCNAPLLTLFLGMAFSKEIRATKTIVMGSLISLIGVALVIFNGSFILKLNPLGDFLALVAAGAWAVYSLLMRGLTNRYNVTFLTRKVFFYGILTIVPAFLIKPWQFPLEKFFTEDWMKEFETDLFCIYRLADGDIYAWDGIFAVRGLDPHKCIVYNSEYTRQDVLVNVIVGGTGRYKGARGLMIGTTEGGGKTQVCGKMPDGSPLELPETIMKDLEGYIRFPDKD